MVETHRIGDTITIKSLDQEPLDSSLEQAIQNLTSRHEFSFPYVSVNIPIDKVTCRLVNAPQIDEAEIFESWLENQYQDLIPDGGWDEYLIRHQLLVHDEDSGKCFFAMIRYDAIERLEKLFESAGLYPVCIGTGILEMAYGLVLTEDFVSGKSHILKEFDRETLFATYQNGVLEELSFLETDDHILLSTILQDSKNKRPSFHGDKSDNSPQIYRISPGNHDKVVEESVFEPQSSQDLIMKPAEDVISFHGESIEGDHMVALGLSMKQLYRDLDDVNFVEPSKTLKYDLHKEKKEAFHLSMGLTALFIGLLVVALSFRFYADYQLSSVEVVAGNMEEQISRVETAIEDLETDRIQAIQIQQLIQDRNYFAPLLQLIGNELSKDMWLSNLFVDGHPQGRTIQLTGFSTAEYRISEFMERLENSEQILSVRLRNSERGQASYFFRDAELPDRQLFLFDINLSYSNHNE